MDGIFCGGKRPETPIAVSRFGGEPAPGKKREFAVAPLPDSSSVVDDGEQVEARAPDYYACDAW